MDIINVLNMLSFILVTIIASTQYIDNNVPRVCDILQLMNILPCYEIKAFKDGKRLSTNELINYINSPVKDHQLKEGILYIEIY